MISTMVVQNTAVVIAVGLTIWLSLFGVPCDRHRESSSLWQRGRAYLVCGKFDLAERHLREAVNMDSGNLQAHVDLGTCLLEMGKTREACTVLEAAVASDTNQADAFVNLGNAYARLGEYKRAERSYRRATEIEPNLGSAWLNLGRLLESAGRTEDAIDAYQRAADAQRRRFPDPWVKLGRLYLDQERLADAENAFRAAIGQDPTHSAGYVGMGRVFERKGEFHTAISLYKRATELDTSNVEAWYRWADIQEEAGELDDAISTLRRGLHWNPDNAPFLAKLATLLVQRGGALHEAEQMAQKATEVAPNIGAAHEALGDVLVKLPSDRAKAAEAYRKAFACYSAVGLTTAARRVEQKISATTIGTFGGK